MLQIIVNVYMPFYSTSDYGQTEKYTDTIDCLQAFLNNYAMLCSVKCFGDFNTRLPTSDKLNAAWYKVRGFNRHSCILYDFMSANKLIAADLAFAQNPCYTYFVFANQTFTWIDHVIVPMHDIDSVVSCRIMDHDASNVSDHLPLLTIFTCKSYARSSNTKHFSQDITNNLLFAPSVRWGNQARIDNYNSILRDKISLIEPPDFGNLKVSDRKSKLDTFVSHINSAVHDSARQAGCSPKHALKPKRYWCPELTQLKNKKKFWWHIWTECGRPKDNVVHECYKSVKKLFRKVSRQCMRNELDICFNKVNSYFNERKMTYFWNGIKNLKRKRVNSSLCAQDMADFYSCVMDDKPCSLSVQQTHIINTVESKYKECTYGDQTLPDEIITSEMVSDMIDRLKCNSSPGYDGITAEHLSFGKSDILLDRLAYLYNAILTYSIVPSVFLTGIIVPILKKSTLNPNIAENYRPIMLSSVLAKMAELFMIPDDNASDVQLGFRKKRSSSFGCAFLHDIASYCSSKHSPVYICALDAQKCFDSVWHDGLLYKLIDILPNSHWLILYKWYKDSHAIVKWNGDISFHFL